MLAGAVPRAVKQKGVFGYIGSLEKQVATIRFCKVPLLLRDHSKSQKTPLILLPNNIKQSVFP